MQIDNTINKVVVMFLLTKTANIAIDVNVIPIDSIYTPIRNVKYQVRTSV